MSIIDNFVGAVNRVNEKIVKTSMSPKQYLVRRQSQGLSRYDCVERKDYYKRTNRTGL